MQRIKTGVNTTDIIGAWLRLADDIKGSILTNDEITVKMGKYGSRILIHLQGEVINLMEYIYKEPGAYLSQYVKHDGQIVFLKDRVEVDVSTGSMPVFCAMHLFHDALRILKSGRVERIKARAIKVAKKILSETSPRLPGKIEEYVEVDCHYGKGIFTVNVRNKRLRKKKTVSGKNIEEISAELKTKLRCPQIISK